jgi:hypothetical protein
MTDVTSGPGGGEIRHLYPAGSRTDDQRPDAAEDGAAVAPRASSKDSVIGLREAGRSYAAIARQLTLPNAVHAQAAFVRAVRQCPEEERAGLVERELGRLNVLEKKIRAADDDDPTKVSERLVALDKLRSALQ